MPSFASAISPFPLSDWQFWVATLLALVALGWLLRALIPWRRLLGRKDKKRGRRATLTLERRPLDGSRPGADRGSGGSGCH